MIEGGSDSANEEFYDNGKDVVPFSKLPPDLQRLIEIKKSIRKIKSGERVPFPETKPAPAIIKKK